MTTPLRILIVEDDEPMSKLIGSMVDPLIQRFPGSQVTVVHRMEEALRIVATVPSPNVVLLDLSLPDSGMAETIEKIDRIDECSPVVIVTGHLKESVQRALCDRTFEIVTKDPTMFENNVLIRAIMNAIERWQKNRFDKIHANLNRMREIIGYGDPSTP